MAKKYVDSRNIHLDERKVSKFEGNIIFSSFNAQNLRSNSRRDDLISLSYLLVYCLEGTLPWLEIDENLEPLEEFRLAKEIKNNCTTETLCNAPDSSHLLPFVKEIFNLQFKEDPDYRKLEVLLSQ